MVERDERTGYDRVRYTGEERLTPHEVAGEPALPVLARQFLLPAGMRVARYSVILSDLILEKGWPLYHVEIEGTAAVGDLDGDGLLELVIPAADGFLHAYDLPGTTVAWAGAAYDWARTGFVPPSGSRPTEAVELPAGIKIESSGNPFRDAVRVRFRSVQAGPAKAAVYDVSGRHVRTLLETPRLEAGIHELTWDGRDATGGAAPAGVYFTRVRAGDHEMTQRIVRVR